MVFCSIENSFAVGSKGGKLFSEKILRKGDKMMATGGLKFDLVKFMNIVGVSGGLNFDIIFLGLTQGTTKTLTHASKDFLFRFFKIQNTGKFN